MVDRNHELTRCLGARDFVREIAAGFFVLRYMRSMYVRARNGQKRETQPYLSTYLYILLFILAILVLYVLPNLIVSIQYHRIYVYIYIYNYV